MKFVVAPDGDSAARLTAASIARRLARAVRVRGEASVAFSGGRTPGLMLAALAEHSLPWGQIDVFQVDERVAPDGDPARNAQLLEVLPRSVRRVALMPVTAQRLGAAAQRYAALLPERLDVVHLGLGADGHTASWPPGDPVIDAAESVALSGVYQGTIRMTLTPHVVNAARARVVLAVGADKADPVQRWLRGDTSVPVSRVHRAGTTVYLDSAAAPDGVAARR
jgi:6-phosphogluconolactonase/glucosamine-6-phosphate isomerase/deaminase